MNSNDRHYVIGLAGHIDHGKTSLVKALTGFDTDRLKEEKERGITVNLGFAHLSDNTTLIDVPGHERLIKNMVAGVSTIDLVIFVVAADDGIMPQTREHLEIINLLGVKNGIFVITKTDLVDSEWVELVEEELLELLQKTALARSSVLKTSVINGLGIEELRKEIFIILDKVPARQDDGIFRLPVDRVFSKSGFGNIVTGSVLSGNIRIADTVEIIPGNFQARVRGLQTHDHNVDKVKTGYRAALNLAGISKEKLHRGLVVCSPGFYKPVEILNAKLTVLSSSPVGIKNKMRLRFHIHTTEVFARISIPELNTLQPSQTGYVQFRLEKPVFASPRDRFIIRQYSPQLTFGGGQVLEINPPKYRKKYHQEFTRSCQGVEADRLEEKLLSGFLISQTDPLTRRELRLRSGLTSSGLHAILEGLLKEEKIFHFEKGKEEFYYSKEQVYHVLRIIDNILNKFHNKFPARLGLRFQELNTRTGKRIAESLVELTVSYGLKKNRLERNGEFIASGKHRVEISTDQMENLKKLESLFRKAEFNPPTYKQALGDLEFPENEFRDLLEILREQGKIVLIDERLFFHNEAVRQIIKKITDHFEKNKEMTVPEFKEMTGTSRKFAIPLLTYLDTVNFTTRVGDVRLAGAEIEKKIRGK